LQLLILKQRRRNRSAKKYREEHAEQIKERERQSREERKSVFKLLKRVAKIALKERGRRFYVTTEAEFDVFKRLYEGTPMVGAALDPATLLNPTLPATIETFPYFVTIYLRPNKWPKVITNQAASGLPPILLIKQIPGDEEYRALSLLFHPDRTRPRESSVSDGDTFKVKPNAAMATLLNAGYDLWKPTVRSRLLAEEPYDSLTADDNEFAKRSQSHANALELFGSWFRITCQASNAMVPGNRSMAEMHHFVNTIPEREEDSEEPEVESSDSDNDDEEWARMPDIGIIYHAKNLAEKKPGRPRKADKGDESEETEEE
jgi:hypothetical protein